MSTCPRCTAPAQGWQCGTCGVDLSDLVTYTYQGRAIRIVAWDSDPTCDVWVVFEDDPDHGEMVPASEIKVS